MSDIVDRVIRPTVEFIENLARKIPEALGKGHHRIGQHIHTAANEFDKVEDDLAAKAGHHAHNFGEGHHNPEDLAGAGTAAAAGAAGGERAAANAARNAEGGDTLRPEDGDRASVPGDDLNCVGDPVDVATGDMVMPAVDVRLPGSLPLVLGRTHISSYRQGTWFGPSWASTLDQRLQLDADGVVFACDDGMRLEYPPPRGGSPVLPRKGPRLPLTWSGVPNDAMRISHPKTGRTLVFDHPRPLPGLPGAITLRLVAIEDRNRNRIVIDWADDDSPALITHHGGYRVAIDRHPTLRRVAAYRLLDTDGPGTETTILRFAYNDTGDLVEVVNSAGDPLHLAYDDQHRVTGWTDRNGTEYGYAYDDAGRVVRTTGSDGFMAGTFEYDDESRATRYTDSLGHTTTYQHNDAYRLVRTTDPLGNTTLREWDDDNRLLTAVTDPLGNTTRFAHDTADNLIAVVHPDGATTEATYNEFGLPVHISEPGGRIWRNEYDEHGNRRATTDPMGARTEFTHDTAGGLTSVTDALGGRHRLTNDPTGLPIALIDPLGNARRYSRDAFGRVVTAVDPLGGATHQTWTVEGKPLSRTFPDGTTEVWSWDGEGNLISHTNANDAVTTFEITHFDLTSARTTPDGARIEFTYNTERRLTAVTNPQGHTWTYGYDPAGRLVREADFNGRTLTYAYDAAGNLLSRTNGADETTTYTRDSIGRLVEYTDGEETTTYAYDPAGNPIRAANGYAEIMREYDPMGRVLTETVNGRRMSYAYDLVGRVVERRTPTDTVSTWSYDASGLPQALGVAGHRTGFSFDELGRETSRDLGAEVGLSQTWDVASRLISQTLSRGTATGQAPLERREFTYRGDDFLTEISDLTTGGRRFELDMVGRVSAVHTRGWTENYAYDALGNLTQMATPLVQPDEVTRELSNTLLRRAGRTWYEYDAQGRTVRTTKRLLNGQTRTRTFAWNAQDQLIATVAPDGTRWRYAYDPAGRRIAKQRLGADGAVAQETHFAWSDTRLAEQTTADGRTTTWEYAPGTYRPLAQVDHDLGEPEADARFYAIITDLVGTPTELISSDGEIAWRQHTTLWGTPVADSGDDALHCPLRFPGQYADPETGWNYNFFRHYDPETARYATPDPLGLDPAPNPAGYVDNPCSWSDPLGLAPGVCPITGAPINPRGYTSIFEMQLDPADFGRSRAVHFNRANTALDDAITADPELGRWLDQFSPGIAGRVSSTGGRQVPAGFTWQHEPAANAGGRLGVMRLVPTYQHTPGSPWWDVLHPGNSGGYAEWGIPNGAPPNRRR